MRSAGQRGGRLDDEHGADSGQRDGDDDGGAGLPRARLPRLAPLGPESPDEDGRPRHVGQDAESDREYAQAVIVQARHHRDGTADMGVPGRT